MVIYTPDWVKHAIFYQIFPDRFARSPRLRHQPGLQFKPWGSPPEEQGFQGGDLLGIVDKLDYIQDLGITALYLNPIFASAANHRYHTYDYFLVDPLLGGNAALRELLDAAHNRGLRVVLDGVFNHASRGFWAFHHILENGPDSPYLDWFSVKGWPLRPYFSTPKRPPNYECWWNLPALPKFNIQNPGVRDYLMEVARYWIDFGIDGWRLDVPYEIDDDSFWQRFRQVVKEANPEAYICGEIWYPAQRWLQGDQFDAVMNYPFSRAALGFFGAETLQPNYQPGDFELKPLTAAEFARKVDEINNCYHWDINCAQLNLLDSHDTARALWIMGDDQSALRLAVLFMMTMPGAPCIYYGDEIGLSSPGDPFCREAFPWQNEDQWDKELWGFFHAAITLRHRYRALRTGDFHSLSLGDNGLYAFGRVHEKQTAIVVFNTGRQQVTLNLDIPDLGVPGQVWQVAWGPGSHYEVTYGQVPGLTIPGREAVILINDGDVY